MNDERVEKQTEPEASASKRKLPLNLLRLFVNRMLIAMGAELLQLHAPSGIAAILLGGVARNPSRSLVGVRATLGTLQRDHNADTFSHNR